MWYDPGTNMLIYDEPQAKEAAKHVEDVVYIGPNIVCATASLRNVQIFRAFGLPVVPVVDISGYDYPIKRGLIPRAHQKIMTNFMVLHPKSFNLSDMGCVDADTEYLSPTGWRRIADYTGGPVGQYHKDGRVELVEPLQYVVRPCMDMYRFKTTRGVDQKLSAEHRVVYKDRAGELKVTTAHDVAAAQERSVMGWKGRFITTFRATTPGVDLSAEAIRVMVAVIADGSFPREINYCVINVKKQRKKDRMATLLDAAGIPYKAHHQGAFTRFCFQAPRREKEFTSFWWGCSAAQLATVAEECPHWDGSFVKAGSVQFFSTVKASADFVQYAFAATGRTASLGLSDSEYGPCWRVHARADAALLHLTGCDDYGVKTDPVSVEPTMDGKKYCFEVSTNMLVLRRNGCIFVTGNTMKTLATLWACDYLMLKHPGTKALIVCPLSIMQRVWGDAIFTHLLGRRTFTIIHGSAERRRELLKQDTDFYIINFDGVGVGARLDHKGLKLEGLSRDIHDRKDIDIIAIDEASAYRSGSTRRHRIAREVFRGKSYLWPLTGTPTSNGPLDAHGLARLVNNAFGESFRAYKDRVMYNVGGWKWVPKVGAHAEAYRLLQPSIRFEMRDCTDVPPCTEQMRDVELSSEQKKLYDKLRRDLTLALDGGKQLTAAHEAALRLKLIQISCGALYDHDKDVHRVDAGPRLSELRAVIEEAPSKIIIFTPLTSVVHMLYSELTDYSRAMINGEIPVKVRDYIFNAFQTAEHPRIIIADPATMSHGLDLFAASVVVWYGATDRTELYLQANRRIDRPGQTRHTTIVQLAATPVEREIYRRIASNTGMQGAILEMVKQGDGKWSSPT